VNTTPAALREMRTSGVLCCVFLCVFVFFVCFCVRTRVMDQATEQSPVST